MSCIRYGNGFLCGCNQKVYSFNGWFFEWHSYCGPWPLKKDGELRKRAGDKFWKVIEKFQKLNSEQKENCRVK